MIRSALRLRLARALVALALALLAAGQGWAQTDAATPPVSVDAERTALASAVVELLAGIDDHPALRAARRSLDAARAELGAVRFPVSLEGELSAQRPYASATAAPGVPQEQVDELLADVDWTTSASVRARLRPFLVGDLADLGAQRRIAVARDRKSVV